MQACRLTIIFLLVGILSVSGGMTQSLNCSLDSVQNIFWNNLSGNNGLSQNSVTSFLQDSKGFIWIGTYDGLNRFDGFATQIKRHESNDSNSLSDNRILCLHEDSRGNILIGTEGGGLNIFDPALDIFRHISLQNDDFAGSVVWSICTDQQGNIWVGTSNNLYILPNSKKETGYKTLLNTHLLKGRTILKTSCDFAGNIWIGTNDGLYICKPGNNLSERINNIEMVKGFEHSYITAIFQDRQHNIWLAQNGKLVTAGFVGDNASNELILRERYSSLFGAVKEKVKITGIVEDVSGNLWISSRNAGLFKFQFDDGRNTSSVQYYNTQQPFCNISEDHLSSLFIDQSNTLWVGTVRRGVNYFNISHKKFYLFSPLQSKEIGELGYKGKFIDAIADDGQNLWIGTSYEGLYQYNKCSRKLFSYFNNIGSNTVLSMFLSKDQTLWIGTETGLYKVSAASQFNQLKRKIEPVKKGIVVRSICEDKSGNLWIATWDGLIVYNRASNTSKTITVELGLSSNKVYTLYADPLDSIIWAGTIGAGLNQIRYQQNKITGITYYRYDPKNLNSLSNNHVWCIYRDKKAVLWIGTDAGLNALKMDRQLNVNQFKHINNPTLKDRKITAILEDSADNLWLGSSQGLFRYNNLTNDTRQYTYRDGLQSNSFTEAAFRNREGVIYFGGINGLNYFKPDQIKSNPYIPYTAIVDFKIFNEPVRVNEKVNGSVLLKRNINATDELVLSYKQNNFLFNFASLHYAAPEDNRFKYKLEGYDKNWIITDHTQRFAAYSNLEPGTYTFLITSSNNDGIWNNNIRNIKIIVKPAPWLTWWAKTIYVLVLISIGIAWLRYYKIKSHLKNQLFVEKLEKEKAVELNEIKLDFFTNITHELRTPLNLITGPLQDLVSKLQQYDAFTQFRLTIIHRNAQRLFLLINQVLDLRKISSENEKLFITPNNLTNTINEIKNSFNWMTEQKRIDLKFTYSSPDAVVWFDKDKIEKVIFNIIANAFKYTPDEGVITIDCTLHNHDKPDSYAEITIIDSGCGIEEHEQDKIFDLFYQGKKQEGFGTGIGLALSKKLIELHNGDIKYETSETGGARFIITFPVGSPAFIMQQDLYKNNTSGEEYGLASATIKNISSGNEKENNRKKTILVI